jgi:hypothetical protein
VASGVRTASVVRVREVEALGFETFLNFCEVGSGANFAKSDDIRRVAGEDLDDCLFFGFRLWRALEEFLVHIAVHGEPVFHVVVDEAECWAIELLGLGSPWCCGACWLACRCRCAAGRCGAGGAFPVWGARFFLACGAGEEGNSTEKRPEGSRGVFQGGGGRPEFCRHEFRTHGVLCQGLP